MPFLLLAAVLAATYLVFFVAPRESQMGEVYKIFYFHVSSATVCLVMLFGCALLSIGFLVLRRTTGLQALAASCDRVAASMAEIGVLFGVIVLVTGPLWAKPAWGTFWTWEPRLTLMLLTVFLFVGYLVLRGYAGSDESGKRLSAGIAVVGIPAALLVHFAIDLWKGGNHPQVITGDGGGLRHADMQLAFTVTLLAVWALAIYLTWMRYQHHQHRDEAERLFLELEDLEDAAT
jgi:heme exporter protein C